MELQSLHDLEHIQHVLTGVEVGDKRTHLTTQQQALPLAWAGRPGSESST